MDVCTPKALIWNLPEASENGRLLREVLASLSCDVSELDESMLARKVGCLAGLEGFDDVVDGANIPSDFGFEFLLMCHIDQDWLESFLDASRKLGLRIARKAVLTDTNRNWRLHNLISAIDYEHEAMSALGDIRKLLVTAKAVDCPDPELSEAVALADAILKTPEPQLADIKNILEKLKLLTTMIEVN